MSIWVADNGDRAYIVVCSLTPFIEERTDAAYTSYLFNGKELDEETGLYYYGARYYDARISMWYGVDKLLDKYIFASPFAFTLNNPIKLLDPDGKEVTNPKKMVLNNKTLIKKLSKLNKSIIEETGLRNSGFTIKITGGDRYKKDGKIYSLTHKDEKVKGSVSRSRHLIEEGARAVDLMIINDGDGKVTAELITKLAKKLGFSYSKTDYPDNHIHIQLSSKDSEDNLTSEDQNIPNYFDLNEEKSSDDQFQEKSSELYDSALEGDISITEFYEGIKKLEESLND